MGLFAAKDLAFVFVLVRLPGFGTPVVVVLRVVIFVPSNPYPTAKLHSGKHLNLHFCRSLCVRQFGSWSDPRISI